MGNEAQVVGGGHSSPSETGRGAVLDGGAVRNQDAVVAASVEMPRPLAELGSFFSRDGGATVEGERPRQSAAFGLKQIDHADLATYPRLREVLERVGEIAAHIRKDTGLTLDLSKITFDVCPADDFVIRMYKEAISRCGMGPQALDEALRETHPENRQLSKQLKLAKFMASGVFMPTEETILLNGDILQRGNANNLAVVLYHELIHAAQFQNFPGFFETISAYGKIGVELSNQGLKDSPEYRGNRDSLDACMQVLEGMPTSLQTKNSKEYFPGASDGLGFFHKAWAAGQQLFTREGWNTLMKYIGGSVKYSALQKVSPHIDHLAYQVPEFALLLGKKEGEVVINLPHGATAEQLSQVGKVAEVFVGLNRGSRLKCNIRVAPRDQESAVATVDPAPILKVYEEIIWVVSLQQTRLNGTLRTPKETPSHHAGS